MPKVSIIIPNFNCSQWLPKVVESCLIQKHVKEIIIVDDQSNDSSWELLESFQEKHPHLIRIFKNPQKGGNNARNFGFSQSTGEYIQWLDADDFLLEGKLEKQIATFKENPEAEIVFSDWYMDCYNENGILDKRIEKVKEHYQDFTYEILSDNWSVPANYLFKRTIVEKLHQKKAWNPQTRVAQDREYLTMAVLNGAKAAYCPGFYCVYNVWNKNSVSSMDFKTRLKYQLVLEKRFRDTIIKNNFPNFQKKKYLSLINAHVMNACFYNTKLTINFTFSFYNIKWSIIHWKKWPFIPFIYLWQHLKLVFNL